MSVDGKGSGASLPYANNLRIIALTVAINVAMAFAFQFGQIITWNSFVIDATICGVTTSVINVLYAWFAIGRLRSRGALPAQIPESALMRRLPKGPALIIVFALVFAALMAVFSTAVAWFFEIETYAFYRFVVWKAVYSAILSAKILELAVLRFVQPDCAREGEPAQAGAQAVKNPLPRRDTFKNIFNTVVEDFGFNMLIGLVFGGTFVYGHDVVISATTRSGIIIGGLILGVLLTLRMVLPVAKQIRALRDSGGLPTLPRRTPIISLLPEKPALFALCLLVPVMVMSAAVLWAVLTFFGFDVLNFFQYFVVRTIYVTLLTKPVVKLAVLRYMQPDSAASTYSKGGTAHV